MTDMNENGCPVSDNLGDLSPTDKDPVTPDEANDEASSVMTDEEWWDEFEAERFDEMSEVEDQPDEMIWTQFEDGGVIEYHPGRHEGGGGYYVGIKPWGAEHAHLVITVDDDDLRALGGYK